MNRAKLKNALLVVLIAGVPIAYFVGGTSGFVKGYAAATFSRSADAQVTVFMLRKLRTGDIKTAIGILESQLDILIIDNRVCREGYRSVFNLTRVMGVGSTATVDKLASSAVAYRASFPSVAPAPAKAAIDSALADLAKLSHE